MAGDDKRQSVRRGVLLVISSPSGAGKTTLSRNLLEAEKNIAMSVSVTTRPRRQSEIEGSHYFFKSVPEFAFMRDSGQLLEWAEVHGNFYGTPRDAVMKALAQGQDVLFDIDVQGTHQLAAAMPEDVVRVFVLPPSIDEMRRRLKRRAEDDDATIIRRLRTAETELRHWDDYDYVIVNDDLDRAFSELRAILDAERLRRVRRPAIKRLVEQLQHDLAAVVAAN